MNDVVVPPPLTFENPTIFKSARRAGVDMIIIHAIAQEIWWPVQMSGEASRHVPAVEWLSVPIPGRANGVSAHCTIDPNGVIHILCADQDKAWHAGESEFENETDLNRVALGVELEVQGKHDYGSFLNTIRTDCYTSLQYRALGWLIYDWMKKFPAISTNRVLGHSDVSGDSVRGEGKGKRDPGLGFNWQRAWREFEKWGQHEY